MQSSLTNIPLWNLSLAMLPVLVALAIVYRWSVGAGTAVYALVRMVVQLLLIGYVLDFMFGADNGLIIVGVLCLMLIAASWISLRPLHGAADGLFMKALGAIAIGGGTTLLLVTQGVLRLDPWFEPRFMIPLAGMIFANAMNTISLSGERYFSERKAGSSYEQARRTAVQASMIPLLNMLFAVGVVSIPGMMTGQILSGISPLIAVRYQIMVMCMVIGSAGISVALYLIWLREVDTPTEKDEPD